jgi:hypothetical protein
VTIGVAMGAPAGLAVMGDHTEPRAEKEEHLGFAENGQP